MSYKSDGTSSYETEFDSSDDRGTDSDSGFGTDSVDEQNDVPISPSPRPISHTGCYIALTVLFFIILGIVSYIVVAKPFAPAVDAVDTPGQATETVSGTVTRAIEVTLTVDGKEVVTTSDSLGDATEASEAQATMTSDAGKSASGTSRNSSQSTQKGISTSTSTNHVNSKPAQSTTTNTKPSPTSTTSNATAGSKKGIGYNDVGLVKNFQLSWAYNWNYESAALSQGVEFVPMMWGAKSEAAWSAAASKAISSGSTHLLGFNECDIKEQCNLTPAEAVTLWKKTMQPFAGKVELISPAVSNGVKREDGAVMGIGWLQEFIKLCTECTIDAVALRWYSETADQFEEYFSNAAKTLNKPIWLTEFMITPKDTNKQIGFINKVVPWLEQQSFIERFAIFGAFADNPVADLVTSDGTLNEIGQAYNHAK